MGLTPGALAMAGCGGLAFLGLRIAARQMRPAATDGFHGGARVGICAAWRSLPRRVKLGAIGS
eukprot:11036239-Alexandrium_andersonii.AAC.1